MYGICIMTENQRNHQKLKKNGGNSRKILLSNFKVFIRWPPEIFILGKWP